MQCVADVCEMLQQLAACVCEVGELDERFSGTVWKQVQGELYDWQKFFNGVKIGDNGSWAREGGS